MSMTRRIFKNTMLIVVISVFLCIFFILGILYDYFNKRLMSEMNEEAVYIAGGVEKNGLDYLESIENTEKRITWIAADGTVLFDNKTDAVAMDNHIDREEIKEALKSSVGNSTRHSYTLSEETIYHAIRIKDGSVVRIAGTEKSIFVIVLGIMQPVLVVVVAAFILAATLSLRLSRQIVEPLDKLDLDNPNEAEVYDEMSPFIRKIILQNEEIEEKIEELQSQKKEFSLITDNMQEGFVVVDKSSNILSYNKGAAKLFGVYYPLEGKNILALNRMEEFADCVNASVGGRHSEMVINFGESFYNIYANPVFDAGEPTGAIIIITDVTEKEERDILRREFSANVSHELKTPLTSISGIAEVMKNGILDACDIPKFAGKIYDEAGRLIKLVEDIISLSKLDETENLTDMVKIDLFAISEMVVKRLEEIAKKQSVKLFVKGKHIYIKGVLAIIDDMIYNLVENGVKYNREGGQVTVSVYEDMGKVALTVSDTGIGIAKDKLDRIFERFYRADKSRSKEIGGTGLGLSIVKHGAKLHNAEISVESELDRGTVIKVIFESEKT